MSDLIKKIKIKKQDDTYTDYIPIGAEAKNVDCSDGESVEYKLNKKPYYYNSVADMKADTKLKVGDMAVTLGYYESNDGGGAEYRIVKTSDKYVENLENSLKAELIVKNEVNIKQFGAYGDGIHSDSNIFLNVLNNYKNVFIPEGNYLINNHIRVENLHKLYGVPDKSIICILSDSTIQDQPNNSNGFDFHEINNLLIENLVFNDITPVKARFSYNIEFTTCTDVLINNIEVKGNCGTGLFFWQYCKNCVIQNSYIHDTKSDGIHIQRGAKNFRVLNCHFYNTEDDCVGFVTHRGEVFGKCDGIVVDGCYMDTTSVAGSGICISGSDNAIITNNTIKNTVWGGIRVAAKQESGETTIFYPDNIIIDNNYIFNTGTANTGIASAIYANAIKSMRITNNTIKTTPKNGIDLIECSGEYLVENNTIEDSSIGIIVTPESTVGREHGDSFIININNNILRNIKTHGIQVNGLNSSLINENKNFAIISNNILSELNTSNINSAVGITSYNIPFTRITKNIIKSTNSIANYYATSVDDINHRVYDNYPVVSNREHIMIGTQKQIFKGSAPTTGNAGDVVWNWNPASGTLLWYCKKASTSNENAEWVEIKWTDIINNN